MNKVQSRIWILIEKEATRMCKKVCSRGYTWFSWPPVDGYPDYVRHPGHTPKIGTLLTVLEMGMVH